MCYNEAQLYMILIFRDCNNLGFSCWICTQNLYGKTKFSNRNLAISSTYSIFMSSMSDILTIKTKALQALGCKYILHILFLCYETLHHIMSVSWFFVLIISYLLCLPHASVTYLTLPLPTLTQIS